MIKQIHQTLTELGSVLRGRCVADEQIVTGPAGPPTSAESGPEGGLWGFHLFIIRRGRELLLHHQHHYHRSHIGLD